MSGTINDDDDFYDDSVDEDTLDDECVDQEGEVKGTECKVCNLELSFCDCDSEDLGCLFDDPEDLE